MKPRNLPVFHQLDLNVTRKSDPTGWDVLPEGYDTIAHRSKEPRKLAFYTRERRPMLYRYLSYGFDRCGLEGTNTLVAFALIGRRRLHSQGIEV